MCDVDNPLCGPNGATMCYGKQKGGTVEVLEELEELSAATENVGATAPTRLRTKTADRSRFFIP